MKIQIYSDLHLNGNNCKLLFAPIANILVLSGDITKDTNNCFLEFINYVSKNWEIIFYVYGNHELLSKSDIEKVLKKYKNIYILNNTSCTINDYVFIGSTKDTNYIETKIKEYKDRKKIIVITHYAPYLICLVKPGYEHTALSSGKHININNILKNKKPNIWIYGHTHYSKDIKHDGIRWISNQMGHVYENTGFNPIGVYYI